jgi:hypothetical protein
VLRVKRARTPSHSHFNGNATAIFRLHIVLEIAL